MGKTMHAAFLLATLVSGALLPGCAAPPQAPAAAVTASLPREPLGAALRGTPQREGCFAGQVSGAPFMTRLAAAAVHIVTPTGKGDKLGSGFVVRNSGVPGHPRNRIVTAGHVIDDILAEGGLLQVVSSSGVRLGYADVVVRGKEARGFAADSRGIVLGDIAVIEMRGWLPGGEAAFAAIEGVDVAAAQPSGQVEGLFSEPAGIVGGTSGSMMVDQDGEAAGVLIASATSSQELFGDPLWSARVRVPAGSPNWQQFTQDGAPERKVVLPARSRSFAEPISDPRILEALGQAGAAAAAPGAPRRRRIDRVAVVGYPAGDCVVYRGDVALAGTLGR